MPPDNNTSFGAWLKCNNTINISYNVDAVRMTYEGITRFYSLTDFDKKRIELLPTTFKEKISTISDDPAEVITAEPDVPGSNIYSIKICQLIVVFKSA